MTQIDRFTGAFSSHLEPLEGVPRRSRLVVPDGDDGCWLHGAPGQLLRQSLDGSTAVVNHPCQDPRGNAIELDSGVALASGSLFVAGAGMAYLLEPGPAEIRRVKHWELMGNPSNEVDLAADPAGKTLAALTDDYLSSPRVAGKTLAVPAGSDPFSRLAVSADGARIATGRESGRIELRDPQNLDVQQELKGFSSSIQAIAFSPDGRWLAAADDVTRCLLFDLQTAGATQEVSGLSKTVSLCWMPDSSGFVAVCLSRLLGVVDLADSETARHCWPKNDFKRRYFDAGTLVGQDTIAVRVESIGVMTATFG